MIKLNNYGHFPQFFFLKVALFYLQSFYLFFLFKYYMSVVPVKYLHFRFRQKRNVDFTNGRNQGRPGFYLVNKLEIEVSSDLVGDFEAFFSVSLSSFLACYNWLQQLCINKQKQTIFQSCSFIKFFDRNLWDFKLSDKFDTETVSSQNEYLKSCFR